MIRKQILHFPDCDEGRDNSDFFLLIALPFEVFERRHVYAKECHRMITAVLTVNYLKLALVYL